MAIRNSYQVEHFRDGKEEIKRLAHRAYARLAELIPTLKSLGLKPSMRVLDVGSGPGVRTVTIAKYVTRGEVVGIDLSDVLIKEAEEFAKRERVKNVLFVNADILKPPKTLGKFDFIHIRLVVQHLDRPELAIRNCFNLLKRHGVLFIEDTDRDWMMLYPSPMRWNKAYERIKQIQIERGGDPQCGRKLATYIESAGFKSVESKLVTVNGGRSTLEEWLENYAPTYFSNMKPAEAKSHLRALRDIRSRLNQNRTYFYQVWFQASGRKA